MAVEHDRGRDIDFTRVAHGAPDFKVSGMKCCALSAAEFILVRDWFLFLRPRGRAVCRVGKVVVSIEYARPNARSAVLWAWRAASELGQWSE